jgi:hypothetical protein
MSDELLARLRALWLGSFSGDAVALQIVELNTREGTLFANVRQRRARAGVPDGWLTTDAHRRNSLTELSD